MTEVVSIEKKNYFVGKRRSQELYLTLKLGETFFLCEGTGVENVFSVLSGGESEV